MRRMLTLTGIALAVCSLAAAQESTGDRIVVPVRNSARPRKVDLQMSTGSATIKAYNGKEVIIESAPRNRSESPRTVNGMRRIDIPGRGFTVEEEDNVITIRNHHMPSGGVVISVPADTSVSAEIHNGGIDVEGLHGEFDIQASNGAISLTNVSGSVVAHSLNGSIKVSMDRVDATKPLSFSTLNGTIDVTLPATWKANVKLSTNRGEIWSDFDFKLGGGLVTQENNSADGKFRVTADRTIAGTVNGGGPEASFRTFNGRIYIKKK